MMDGGTRRRRVHAPVAARPAWPRRHAMRGQALTELVLVLPLLALLFIGVLDLGRAYHTQVAVSNAARVGLLFAQQVSSPRMMDCAPGTTCRFITVADIITQTVGEAQGGLDPRQMRVGVCLQHVAACPITDPTIAVASDEAITVSVTVPFTTITPLVHLGAVSGAVSGRTFAFQPVAPTAVASPTPGVATATATATATPAATAATATPQPTPVIAGDPTVTTCDTGCGGSLNKTATLTWSTNQAAAGNTVHLAVVGTTSFTSYVASGGTSATLTFTSKSGGGSSYTLLPSGYYSYYVQSATTGGVTSSPACAPSSCASGAYPSFYLP